MYFVPIFSSSRLHWVHDKNERTSNMLFSTKLCRSFSGGEMSTHSAGVQVHADHRHDFSAASDVIAKDDQTSQRGTGSFTADKERFRWRVVKKKVVGYKTKRIESCERKVVFMWWPHVVEVHNADQCVAK